MENNLGNRNIKYKSSTYWLGAAATAAAVVTAVSGFSTSGTGVAGLDATAEVSGVGVFSRPFSGE